jgi:hypothetical protein
METMDQDPASLPPLPVALGIPNVVEIDARREQLANSIKARLGKPSLAITDARDGIRDCFISTYLGGTALGLSGFGVRGSLDQVTGVVSTMFRKRLEAAGSSLEQPSIAALRKVKDELDRELHLDGLPAELRAVHDQVCGVLLSKVPVAKVAAGVSPVEVGVRSSIAALLRRAADRADAGAGVEVLQQELARTMRLIDALRDLADE